MKKCINFSLVVMLIFSTILFGCKKSEVSQSNENTNVIVEQNEVPLVEEPKVETFWADAVSIYSNAGVYELNDEGKLRWVGSFPKGMNVYVKMVKGSTADEDSILISELNFSNDKEDAKPTKMATVDLNGCGFYLYVVAANLVPSAKTGVIISDEANLFSKDELKTMTNVIIPENSICAVHNIDDDESDFYCITTYVSEGEFKGLYRKKFVEKKDLSMDNDSVVNTMCQDRIATLKDVSSHVVEAIQFFYDGNTQADVPSDVSASGDIGFLLADPSYLYKRDGNNLSWLETVDVGTSYEASNEVFTPEKINNKPNNSKLKFEKVKVDGQEGWVLSTTTAYTNSTYDETFYDRVAILMEDTPVHTWGHKAAFEKFILKAGTVVACVDSSKDDEYVDPTLQKIYAYEKDVFWKVRPMYIRKGILSFSKGDYDALMLAKAASLKDSQKDMEIIVRLFSLAAEKTESPSIASIIGNLAVESGIKDLYFPCNESDSL